VFPLSLLEKIGLVGWKVFFILSDLFISIMQKNKSDFNVLGLKMAIKILGSVGKAETQH